MNTAIDFAGLDDTRARDAATRCPAATWSMARAGFGTLCVGADFSEETAHYNDPAKAPYACSLHRLSDRDLARSPKPFVALTQLEIAPHPR
jgi:hypothetical protein